MEGFKAGAIALAIAATAILGGTKLSPSFARSLSVSAKTALIVSGLLFVQEIPCGIPTALAHLTLSILPRFFCR